MYPPPNGLENKNLAPELILHNLRPSARPPARESSFGRQQQEEASNGKAKFRVDTYTGWK